MSASRLVVPSPDPYAPSPVVVDVITSDHTIHVRSRGLPGGDRTSVITRMGRMTSIATRIDDPGRVAYDLIRMVDLDTRAGWDRSGWAWSAIVCDAIASAAATVWGVR